MAYRNIIVTRNIGISVHNYQLVIGNEDMCVPLEDINCLVLEHAGIMISSGVLQRLSENGCLVYICDEKHLPSTVVLPMARHSRHFKMLTAQLAITKPRQNRIWQQIVKQKIANQAMCLKLCGKKNADQLYNMTKKVQSGDKTNVEAQAAALYFKSLFGNDFTRGDDNIDDINGWLYRRIRMCIWKQWKLPRTKKRKLIKMGVHEYYANMAANCRRGHWYCANLTTVKKAMTKERLTNSGFYDLATAYQSVHVNY